MAPRKLRYVMLTFDSHDALVSRAKLFGYIKRESPYARGLSDYLLAISKIELKDTRPPDYKEADIPRLQSGLMPIWHAEEKRFPYAIHLYEESVKNLLAQAERLHITNHTRAPQTENGILSAVLEALGLSWLTPAQAPPTVTLKRRHRRVEFLLV